MDINEIMRPIEKESQHFAVVLNKFIDSVGNDSVRENYKTFFRKRGKHLRPSLLFLSIKAAAPNRQIQEEAYTLALVLELIHSASLIHDDIIDEDDYRRGVKTVSSVFGNKVGVLAGDTLFTYAFLVATKEFSQAYNEKITDLAYAMCMSELDQANGIMSKEKYLSVILGKTAKFMSVCCELGAMYAGAQGLVTKSLCDYGLNLGMVYQIIDDFEDEDPNALKFIKKDEAKGYYDKGIKALSYLESSPYSESLWSLMALIMA